MTAPAWRSVGASDELLAYAAAHSNPSEDEIATELAAETVRRYGDLAGMNIGQDQGWLMQLLVELKQPQLAVEVGTFTGMSALWIARGLEPGARLVCFDVSEEYPEVGRPYWERAGVADRIEVRIGPARELLPGLAEDVPIDFVFIDADKPNYLHYLDLLLPLMDPKGLILVDNTLWGGAVLDDSADDENTLAIKAFNDNVAERRDCDALMLAVGDGVTVIRPLQR